MIINAILYDLIGAKVWSDMSFYKSGTLDIPFEKIIEEYFTIKRSDGVTDAVDLDFEKHLVKIGEINDSTLLICLNDEREFSTTCTSKFNALVQELQKLAEDTPIRDISKSFAKIAKGYLCEIIHICLVCDDVESGASPTEKAIQKLLTSKEETSHSFTLPAMIGPYGVRVTQMTMDAVLDELEDESLKKARAVAFVLQETIPCEEKIKSFIDMIRKKTTSPLLVIPGHDQNLERARELEISFDMILCDAVSPLPSYFLLLILAMIGLIDMYPELASNKLEIDTGIDKELNNDTDAIRVHTETLGHQAFFVVDKMTGEAIFTYYFEAKADFLRRAPNVIAAITMFSLDSSEDSSTSVFRTGNSIFVMIEYNNLIFTLITGQSEDEVAIRERFSFLPDLWSGQEERDSDDSDNPYHAVPFTLKLLATLPPEELTSKHLPVQIVEPTWENFNSPEVRDFLRAVWVSLKRSLPMNELVQTSGPQMTLGAIHFLKKMGAIDLRVSITESDVPMFTGILDEELSKLYSHLDMIVELTDGTRSILEISKEIKIQTSVLITVFTELHRRLSIDFAEQKSTSTKRS